MRSVLEDNPQVLQFIKDRFNSGDDGRRVHWLGMTEDEEPVAFHLLSIGDYPAHIYVPRHDFKSPVDQCAALIFEFFNLENRNGFIRLRQKALSLTITPQKYADEILKLEYRALGRTKAFFEKCPLPNADPEKDVWYTKLLQDDYDDFDGYLAALNRTVTKGDMREGYKAEIQNSLQNRRFRGLEILGPIRKPVVF
jgi:hypothetical protein